MDHRPRRRPTFPRDPSADARGVDPRRQPAPRDAPGRTAIEATSGTRLPGLDLGDEGTDAADWLPAYREDIAWALDEKVGTRPFELYRLRDVATRHVNIRDGVRATWKAPLCDCERRTVWLYGGGGAFGFEQRDGRTIASMLARAAWDEGDALDVVNRGVPGQLTWRAALRFAWDLTSHPAPDLVVFYAGVEEVDAAMDLVTTGRGDVRAPYEPYLEELYDEIHGTVRPLPPPEGVEALGWPTVGETEASEAGPLAAARYERTMELVSSYAHGTDVPIVHVWHPIAGPRTVDETGSSAVHRAAAAALPDSVLDLSTLFDGRAAPRFSDGIWVDEAGAAEIARVLLDRIAPLLASDGDATRTGP